MAHKPAGQAIWNGPEDCLVYVGNSMAPTFEAPEIIYFVPYGNREVRPGDVVVFDNPAEQKSVTHRVVAVTASGIRTKGDNNDETDWWTLQKEDITGQVVMARRGRRYRRIYGGRKGELYLRLARVRRRAKLAVINLIYWPYRLMARRGLGKKLLPRQIRSRLLALLGIRELPERRNSRGR